MFVKGMTAVPALALFSRIASRWQLPSALRTLGPADQIQAVLNSVQDWSELVDVGTVMSQSTNADYDTWIIQAATDGDWLNVLFVKSFAMHSGYSSPAMDYCVKTALSNASMFEEYSIPITEDDSDGQYFWPFCKYALYGYQYAQELNWETDRWDPNKAFNYLAQVYDSFGDGFYRMNDNLNPSDPGSTFYAERMPYGTRWLELGKLMGCFLILYDAGATNALQYALKCWNQLNNELWKSDHFTYATGWFGYEFSALDVVMDSLKLQQRMQSIPNASNVFGDLYSRYLLGYGNTQWSATQGNTTIAQHLKTSNDGYLPIQRPDNFQLRLDGTLNAWILLHLGYTKLPQTGQTMMRGMLEGNGTIRAFDGLLQSSLAQGSLFTATDSSSTSDGATAMATLCLFLNCISVRNGPGLAIPLITDNENDHIAMNSYHFGFNYDNNEIKIPVWAGTTLNFMFGTNPVQQSFPTTGVYVIDFSWDWNSILSSQLVSGLNPNETYLTP